MSKSVTLYQVSQNNFKQLEMSKGMIPFDTSCANFHETIFVLKGANFSQPQNIMFNCE